MYELRVVALSEDGRHLVLAPVLEGRRERYRVSVDDRMRAALRGELGRLERRSRPDSTLSPREIQSRLRSGEDAESIAAAAGIAVEWVARFEAPVLAERALIAEQARRSTLSVTAGDWTGVPLEQVVSARLEADGVDPRNIEWDSWRRDDGRWVVQARCGDIVAQWLWDPALQRLTVHDDGARALLHPGAAGGDATRDEPRVLVLAPHPVDAGDADEAAGGGDAGNATGNSGDADDPARSDERRELARTTRRSRRAAIPSWEDILLGPGTRPDAGAGGGPR